MDKLIKALLDYSRIGRNKVMTHVDCNKVIQDILEDLFAQITETKTRFDIGDLPLINGSETEMRILFQNLISNATKFRKKEKPLLVRINAQKQRDHWQFSISDNGIGIEPQYHEKIFVIFQRLHTKDKYEGTGIGLAHCQKIVDLHGGKIWLDSRHGRGSTFYFTIRK